MLKKIFLSLFDKKNYQVKFQGKIVSDIKFYKFKPLCLK